MTCAALVLAGLILHQHIQIRVTEKIFIVVFVYQIIYLIIDNLL